MEEREIIGVFDGQYLLGNDKKTYPVPANYASKSRLVYGDQLKLTITDEGKFVFKQISPVDRKRICGVAVDFGDKLLMRSGGKLYQMLKSSITYYNIEHGDEIFGSIPEAYDNCDWVAVENVIKQ